MAYESATFDANLAMVAGDDAVLQAELRGAFHASLVQHAQLLSRARCDANWVMAARRIRGLAASFHSEELMALAQEALDGAPGDPVVQRKLTVFAGHIVSDH